MRNLISSSALAGLKLKLKSKMAIKHMKQLRSSTMHAPGVYMSENGQPVERAILLAAMEIDSEGRLISPYCDRDEVCTYMLWV